MRYVEQAQPLSQGGMGETAVFSIAATGKAFRNLMDGLYSRKLEAVCREIMTNAFDSHTEAGLPWKLFDVVFPTIFDKRLKIRDYGVGMPHEQVMQRYSTLFDSTKDQTDELVGMLGLGSKSPFAYCDNFSLRCWDGQEVRTYAIALGEGGVPQISLVRRVPDDSPRGVEVCVPVASQDWAHLEECLARVAIGFESPPKLNSEVERRMRFDCQFSGDGWAMGTTLALSSGVWARQGCVLYPIPDHLVAVKIPGWKALDKNYSLVFDFDLGELEVTPSRETLSLTERTTDAISDKLDVLMREIGDLLSDKFVKCKSDWEIALHYKSLMNNVMTDRMLQATIFRKPYLSVSQNLREAMVQRRHSKRPEWRFILLRTEHTGFRNGRDYEVNDIPFNVVTPSDSYHTPKISLPETDKELAFVVDSKGDNRKIAVWAHDKGYRRVLVMRRSAEHPASHTYTRPDGSTVLYGKMTEDDILALGGFDLFGNPPFYRASQIKELPKEKKDRAEVTAGKIWVEERFSWVDVDKEELQKLIPTHKFMFFSVQRNCILTPRGDRKVALWEKAFEINELSTYFSAMKLINGTKKNPKIALVRVLPSQEYSAYRKYPVAPSIEQAILEAPARFWDSATKTFLWRTAKHEFSLIDEDCTKLRSALSKCVSPAMRAIYKILPDPEPELVARVRRKGIPRAFRKVTSSQNKAVVNEEAKALQERIEKIEYDRRVFEFIRHRLRTNRDIVTVLVREAKARGYRVPLFEVCQHTGSLNMGSFLSRRWRKFVSNIGGIESDHEYLIPVMEMVELDIQRRGGLS